MPSWMVGVDTGGTFTDLVAVEQETGALRLAKVPSVPGDPSAAVLEALAHLFAEGVAPSEVAMLVHGTTVATNALIEGDGAKVGLIITKGFRAVYEARGWSQPRGSDLLDTFYRKPPLLVPQRLTEEASERLDFEGNVLTPLDEAALRQAVRRLAKAGVEAIAVCFLFSFLNPAHERAAARIIAEEAPRVRVSLSSTVLPVIREYPRLSTTVIDAYVGPRVERYLMRLAERLEAAGSRRRSFISCSRTAASRALRRARAIRTRPCCRVRRRASSPEPRSPRSPSAATSSPSTWAAPAPTSASSPTAACSRPRKARSRARTSARRCCACARWARAAAPSPPSARTGF